MERWNGRRNRKPDERERRRSVTTQAMLPCGRGYVSRSCGGHNEGGHDPVRDRQEVVLKRPGDERKVRFVKHDSHVVSGGRSTPPYPAAESHIRSPPPEHLRHILHE